VDGFTIQLSGLFTTSPDHQEEERKKPHAMNHQFTITLPSNSSVEYFPANTVQHYTTQLVQPIELVGSWEVAMTDILFTRRWHNVTREEGKFHFRPTADAPWYDCQMHAGFYDKPEELLKSIKGVMAMTMGDTQEPRRVNFLYSTVTKKITIIIRNGAHLRLTPGMSHLLGFAGQLNFGGDQVTYIASQPCDMDRGFYALYIYCDLIESVLVGDTRVPLLKIVPVKGLDGTVITKTYQNPQYHSLRQKNFSTVEIDIRDDTGRPVPFEQGRVVATLHFRQRRPYS